MLDDVQTRLAGRYGRKAGLKAHITYRLLFHIGALRRYTGIDWTRVDRLVFVCNGNICRSPYAEFKARSLGLNAASFGVRADRSSRANPVAARLALARGIDLETHRSVPHSDWTPQRGDLLVGMEPRHGTVLESLAVPNAQITLLGVWSKPPRPHIQDPYGLCEQYFDTCFDCIDRGIEQMAAHIQKRAVRTR